MVHYSLWSRVKMVEILKILGIVLHFVGEICSKSSHWTCLNLYMLCKNRHSCSFDVCFLLYTEQPASYFYKNDIHTHIKPCWVLEFEGIGPGKSETVRECVAEEGTVYPVCNVFTMCSLISQVSVSASSPHSFLLNCHLQPITQQINSPGLSLPLSLKHSYLDRETSLILRNIAGKPSHLLTKVTPAPLLSHGRVLCLLW